MTSNLLTRRAALQVGGIMVVAFSLGAAAKANAAALTAKPESLDEVDSFLAIDGKGAVTLYSGKVDLGTGVRTALAQIVAEELGVPFEGITVVQGDTALTPDQGITYGSLSIQVGGMQIRQACATARKALLEQAAQRLSVPVTQLSVASGIVHSQSGTQVSYADLVGGKAFSLKVDKTAPTKPPSAYTVVGKPIPRVDIPAKVSGEFTYAQDFRLPGMLYGRPVRPTAIGATLLDVDESSIQHIPGIVKVVREGNFLGVVAKTEWAAIRAARALKTRWSAWDGLPDERDLWSYVRSTKVAKDDITSNVGNVPSALAGAHRTFKATYDFPIQTHGSIGPSAAVAAFENGKLTVWTAAQSTHALHRQLAAMLGMDAASVRCIYVAGSGCYGRNGHEDAAADAALLARAVGRPVRVQWMRWDEHGWDPKGPPTLVDLKAGVDASGNVVAWHGEFFIPMGAGAPVWLLPAQLAGKPATTDLEPGNIIPNSALPYDFPNMYTVCHRLAATPLRPAWIRTPGRMQNTFANESFLDEIIAAVDGDPLEFRLAHLKDPRGTELLHHVAKLARWQAHEKGSRGVGKILRGRGLSYVHYELVRTYVAAVADVTVDRATGKVRVERAAIAHDCGQIINPDGLRNQIEGNVVQMTSRTLLEEVKFNRSRVTSLDWASYPILRFPDVPEVTIDLIDRPTDPPWGAGEPAGAVIPGAISNAIFDATGVRLRSVPFTPAKVKAALASA
jgi:nicotinate dehydrogenase subunit B